MIGKQTATNEENQMPEKSSWLKLLHKVWPPAVIAACIALVVAVFTAPVFDLSEMQIRGDLENVGLREVRAVAERTLRGNILTANIDTMRDEIERISWVKRVTVRRVWPSAISVSIIRHRAVAIYEDGRLVSDEGVLFISNDESIERLMRMPTFSGDAQYVGDVVRNLPRFSRAVSKIKGRIKGVNVSFRGSWSVLVESDRYPSVTIELGRAIQADDPVNRLTQVVDNFHRISDMMRGFPERIDARYSNAFSAQLPDKASKARWREERDATQEKK